MTTSRLSEIKNNEKFEEHDLECCSKTFVSESTYIHIFQLTERLSASLSSTDF